MKCTRLYKFVIILLMTNGVSLSAQNTPGGIVTYQAITQYDFQTLFADWADDYPDWVNSIPTESKGQVSLAFTKSKALYDTRADAQVLPSQLRDAQAKAFEMQEPAAELRKLYLDLEKNQITRQVEFMGRLFRVADEIGTKPWKLKNKMTKILDYTCMSAELEQDGKSIVAYFTSEIPMPIGPDEYFGLPGLILAVEIDGATAFLAQTIELTPPNEAEIAKPKKGKRVSKEKFEKIVHNKIKEYNETRYEGKSND